MRKGNRLLKLCGRIISIVILLSFLRFPVFAEQQTTQPPSLSEGGMRFYSDSEIDLLIDDISEIAKKAIERAAAEAARAAALAAVEREAAALREAERWRMQAEFNLREIEAAKKTGRKNTLLAALIGVLGGLAIGVTGTLIIGGR